MSVEDDNKAVLQRIYDEVFNAGKIEVIDEIVSPDVVEHEEMPGLSADREGVKQFMRAIREAFPDLHVAPQDVIASGDRVVARIRLTGTQRGEFAGIPPTNKPVDVETIDIVRFEGGRIAEHWGITDQLRMMQQLGVIPEEPAP